MLSRLFVFERKNKKKLQAGQNRFALHFPDDHLY